MSKVAFKPEEATEALKEFVGQVVAYDYSEEPFDMKGAAEIIRRGKVFCLKIQTDVYDKPQYEWYPPSKVKQTKLKVDTEYDGTYRVGILHLSVKWLYLIDALTNTGAMKDISVTGITDDERMDSFGKSMLGMEFRWEERECESLVKEKGGAQKKFNLLVPVEYLRKRPIEEVGAVKQTTISEVSEPASTAAPESVD